MEIVEFLILILVIGVGILVLVREIRKIKAQPEESSLLMFKQDLDFVRNEISQSARFLTKEISELKHLASPLQQLKEFLLAPKNRGKVGEKALEDFLTQFLPPKMFKTQYQFSSGAIVDALIFTSKGSIPIDSKFPLENYKKLLECKPEEEEVFLRQFKKDVKKHIDDISRKYILPEEGTLNFALMFIPSIGAYEKVAQEDELIDYGDLKKVYFVSPINIYPFLQIILLSLEQAQFEQKAKKILSEFEGLKREIEKLGKELDTLSLHILHSFNALERVKNQYQRSVLKMERSSSFQEVDFEEKED